VTYAQTHPASDTAVDVVDDNEDNNKNETPQEFSPQLNEQQADVEVVGHKLVFKY
jgi:hypothetical protein